MIELPDDELDKLFRKSSEEFDPTYEPQDWDALSKRLDQEDGKRPAGWWWKWVPLGLLLLFIPAGLMMYYSSDKLVADRNKKAVSSTIIQAEEAKRKADITERSNGQTAENKIVNEETKPAGETEKLNDKNQMAQKSENPVSPPFEKNEVNKSTKTLPRSRSKAGGVYLEPNRSKREGGYGAISFQENNQKRNSSVTEIIKTDELALVRPSKTEFTKVKLEKSETEVPDFYQSERVENGIVKARIQEENRVTLSVVPLEHSLYNSKLNLPLPEIPEQEPAEIEQAGKQRDLSPKLAIRLGYSPDLSTVGFKNYSKPGKAASLLVEYAVLRKLYIQTGIIGSIKEYRANAGEYELKKYVTDIATPSTIDGICNMIEIPLGVRYDFTQTARSRFFAGTGFSSFYLKKEKYTYNYIKHVPKSKYNWEGTNTGLALFSHLNLSAGYEYRISNKFSLLAEPYLKVPLKGIGYGKVNLMTTGMWLSVRYTPVFK
ncbi:hypothetical protein [Dyadobacter psychrotolerans]|uniref:Outer membrane protein beta-barrel domain-containing protein n=1 Tax=Dyadobacter psychrotolerans TaxID=2541721 RepID=A0A4R5DNS9_9BACT|nr:hypothetical protein [Dyadobacter psychrotolerans]TDE13661.1 hypothetical protein E0F88_17300 [Dyadobacter psychrotolerans]